MLALGLLHRRSFGQRCKFAGLTCSDNEVKVWILKEEIVTYFNTPSKQISGGTVRNYMIFQDIRIQKHPNTKQEYQTTEARNSI